MQSGEWVRSCEGGRLRRADTHSYQLRANERHDLRGILTPKSNHGRSLHTATGGKGHSPIDQRNVAQGHAPPVRRKNDSEQSQLARQRASERDCFEKKRVLHAAIESLGAAQSAKDLAANRDDRTALSHQLNRLVDFNSDSSAEDQQEVESRAKRSLTRRRKLRSRAGAAARAAAVVVTAATMAAPADPVVASAVVAAAKRAVQAERGVPGAAVEPEQGVISVLLERPQRPMSRPAFRGRQSMSGKPTAPQDAREKSLCRAHPPRDDLAASIGNAIATLDEDIAATSAFYECSRR